MFRTLYAKLAIVLAGVFTLVGISFMFLMGVATERFQQEVTQKLNRGLAGQIVAERLLFDRGQIDHDALEHIFHMMMVINPEVEIYLLDPTGRILAFSAPPGKVKRTAVGLGPVRRFLDGEAIPPILGDDPRAPDRRKVFSAAPVVQGGRLHGYLYVILGGEQYDSIVDMLGSSYVLRLSTGVVAAGMLFALLTATVIFAVLTRRLRRLAGAMTTFKEIGTLKSLPRRERSATGDEIDELSDAFQEMAGRIIRQVGKLQQTDDSRRELVANVSHDLRTPLASLHGYLETLLLKDAELDEEQKRRYLEIALKHGTRLNRLVAELFDLAKLDADEVRPHREPFSLPELVQDVVQEFQLQAGQQGIGIEHRIERERIPFVVGDIGLIERVLDNLIENGLRHTPAGGRVIVAIAPGDGRVTVYVSDTGCGIAEHDLPHVFDRFYKPVHARRDGNGAGLGLAIARRILELHGSEIRASSKAGAGTTVTFDLPIQGAPR